MKKWLSVVLSALTLPLMLGGCASAPSDTRPLLDGATLVTFGDSLTALSTWPQDVAEKLNMQLVNSGIGANTTDHAAARFERDVLAHEPDFVIMCFGTNDFYRANGVMPQVSLDDYRANLQSFVDQIKDSGAVPILMTPPFISEGASGGPALYPEGTVNAALDTYVETMREVAAENEVGLIDIHAVCDNGQTVSTFLISDGVHLSKLGNSVFTDEISRFMTENYRQDDSAPRVTQPTAPAAEPGAWTKSIVSFKLDDWNIIYPDTAEGEETEDGAISFWNTNGQWPEVHYSPALSEALTVPVQGTKLNVDVELIAGTNIILFFNGPTPTLAYDTTYFSLTSHLKSADPSIKTSGDDLLGNQHIQCTLELEDIIPESYIADDGTVIFSGVKVFAVGGAYTPVTIHELSVTTAG